MESVKSLMNGMKTLESVKFLLDGMKILESMKFVVDWMLKRAEHVVDGEKILSPLEGRRGVQDLERKLSRKLTSQGEILLE